MAKAKGGLLELLNYVGGNVIYWLIGQDAWHESDRFNALRAFVGGFCLGIPVGMLLSLLCGWIVLLLSPLAIGLLGFALELFREEMTK